MDQPMPQITPPDPKPTKIPVILSVFLCISLAGIGLLLYQNYHLKKQLTISEATQTQFPPVSPEPVAKADDLYREPNGSAATVGWETYTDGINKFSIKYPKDKTAVLRTKDAYMGFCNVGSSIVSIELYNQGQRIPPPEVANEFTGFLATTIATKTLSSGLSPREWTQINCKGSWVTDPLTQVDTILLNGSWLTIYTGGQMGTGSFVVYPKDDRIYLFYGWPVTTTDQMNIFDQILSTFKFTD